MQHQLLTQKTPILVHNHDELFSELLDKEKYDLRQENDALAREMYKVVEENKILKNEVMIMTSKIDDLFAISEKVFAAIFFVAFALPFIWKKF